MIVRCIVVLRVNVAPEVLEFWDPRLYGMIEGIVQVLWLGSLQPTFRYSSQTTTSGQISVWDE